MYFPSCAHSCTKREKGNQLVQLLQFNMTPALQRLQHAQTTNGTCTAHELVADLSGLFQKKGNYTSAQMFNYRESGISLQLPTCLNMQLNTQLWC